MKRISYLFIFCFYCFQLTGQKLLLREKIPGNVFVNPAVSGSFSYVSSDTMIAGYEEAHTVGDVSTRIGCWNVFGLEAVDSETGLKMEMEQVREELRYQYQQQPFSELTQVDKLVCIVWFVATPSERESIYTAEQLKEAAVNFYDLENNDDLLESTRKRNNTAYQQKGYKIKQTMNPKGDLISNEYYVFQDVLLDSFYDLRVRESFNIFRDTVYGMPYMQHKTTEWFIDSIPLPFPLSQVNYFNIEQAYSFNKNSRGNLIDKASIALLGAVGYTAATTFLNTSASEMVVYVSGSRQPLLDKINTYIFSLDPGTNAFIKSLLLGILDVPYVD